MIQKPEIIKTLKVIALMCWLISGFSCRKDTISTDSKHKLLLRTDTIVFDTVFTKNGSGVPKSVNKQLVVLNPNNIDVVTDIRLNDAAGYFKLNVDGQSGRTFENVRIAAGDSIFLFLELYIDPNNDPQSRPLIVRDSITFTTNGNVQNTQLVAWGQDAHYFFNDTLACNTVWNDVLKPYVVYGYVYVTPGCKFTIAEGVKVHFAPYSWLYVEGTLKVEGTNENPVFMEGDRLQPSFEEIAGQWGGIWFDWPSADNSIAFARIKNGTVGIYCDTISANGNPNLIVKNSFIRNMQYDGIAGRMSDITVENCVVANCGRYTFLGQWGGNYKLRHCSFVTYGMDFSRKDPTFIFTNRQRDDLGRILNTFDFKTDVRNCIIYGNQKSEMGFDLDMNRVSGFYLGRNLIKTEEKSLGVLPFTNILNQDPRFVDTNKHDYALDSLSAAIDIGEILSPPINKDMINNNRDLKPDAGALERQK